MLDDLNQLIVKRNMQHGIVTQITAYKKDMTDTYDTVMTHIVSCNGCGLHNAVSGGINEVLFAPSTCPDCGSCDAKILRHVDIDNFIHICRQDSNKNQIHNEKTNKQLKHKSRVPWYKAICNCCGMFC